jgi:hypothetical protein
VKRAIPRLLPLVVLACLGAPASALDQPLGGKRLVMRQGAKSERLVLVARDVRMTTPVRGAPDDPTLHGAVLHAGNPETGEWARFDLAATGWSEAKDGRVFKFRSRQARGAGSEVRALSIRDRKRLKIRAQRIGITLDEPAQRSMAVVLTSGSQRWCTLFGGTVRKDQPGKFAAKNAIPPTACPEPIDAASGSTTTTSTTTNSSTSSSTSSTSSSTTSTSTSSTTTSSTSSTSSVSSTSSSTTTSTVSTCGGLLICGGTCPPGQSCSGIPCACR